MSSITAYALRAGSAEALHALLVTASAGKERPYAWADGEALCFDEARVRLPYPEMQAAESDPETGAPIYAPTGYWRCEVMLIGETDAALAAIAVPH
jgi:hypothetical protein